MFKNYLKIAFRNILKNKIFSFINILGLAIGMAACLLILQYVTFELSYDDFQANKANIYRLKQSRYNKGVLTTEWAAGCGAIGYAMKESFPEVEAFAKLYALDGVVIYKDAPGGPIRFKEEKMYLGTPSVLTMFSFDMIQGNKETALTEPYKVVISESTAKRYFKDEDPIGKRLSLNNRNDFEVTGVFKDIPENSHMKFDFLYSFETFEEWVGKENETDKAWNWDGFYNYISLVPGTNPKALEAKIPGMIEQKIGEEMRKSDTGVEFFLQPFTDIHLYSNYMMEMEVNGNGEAVYSLLIIAFFIIVIAWVNYINLSTAKSIDRAKEVGVRKVMGSYRSQLVKQFLFESILLNALAVLLAFAIVLVTYRYFDILTGKALTLSLFSTATFWWAVVGFFVIGAFFSGIYPAFVLSSFQPAIVLKGKMSTSVRGVFLRKFLVVVQFAASVFLIAGTITVYRQISFMQNQDLGVDISQTLVIEAPSIVNDSVYADRVETFKTELLRSSAIKAVTASTAVPGNKPGWNAGGIKLIHQNDNESNQYRIIGADEDFVDAFGLQMLEGRNFSKDFANDEATIILNESATELMGFGDLKTALDQYVYFWGDTFKIIGVVKDYHQESLKAGFDPLIFRYIPSSRNYYSLKVETSNLPQTIEQTQAVWDDIFPGNPFNYFFLDDHFNQQYQADLRFGKVFGFFAALAIFVACLGLFGLSSFMATQRTKEIGVRKVLGASIISILALLSKEFVKLILIASFVALPLAYFMLQNWLSNYAFHINISWWLFVLPLVAVLVIALFTVSFQSLKAALANPVDTLRNE